MGWDGSGNVVRTNGTNTGGTVWQDDKNAGTKIRSDLHDTHDQDLADAIERTLNLDGENKPAANINWGGYKITNAADATTASGVPTLGQVQSRISGAATATGTDSLAATFSPALTALTDKTTVYVRAAAANTSTTPTFSPNGLAAKTITKNGNNALEAGDIAGAGHVLILQYNASNDVWELLNPTAPAGHFPNVNTDVTATAAEIDKLAGITGNILTSGNDGPFYSGAVASSGGSLSQGLPSGWSATRPQTGNYTITHNLGHTSYIPICVLVVTGLAYVIEVQSINNNDFKTLVRNTSSAVKDASFYFMLIDLS